MPIKQRTPTKAKLLRLVRRWMPILLFLAAISVLFVAVPMWWNARQLEYLSQPTSQIDTGLDVDEKIKLLEQRLDVYNRRAADVQWMLSALLAMAALYTLLQSVFAYFSVQNFNKQAEEAVKNIEKLAEKQEHESKLVIAQALRQAKLEARKFRLEMKRRLPMFSGIDRAIDSVFAELTSLFLDVDWREDWYEKLDDTTKQKIFYYEKSVAGLEFLDLPNYDQILRGLGNFYASKYKSEKAHGRHRDADLQRCRFYLYRALEKSHRRFRVLK